MLFQRSGGWRWREKRDTKRMSDIIYKENGKGFVKINKENEIVG